MEEFESIDRRAQLLAQGANGLCYARMIAGPVIGAYLANTEPAERNGLLPGVLSAVALTDALDGTMARAAQSLDPTISSEKGAWLDQMADKVLYHSVVGGMVIGAVRRKQYLQASILGLNQGVQLARDIFVTRARAQASTRGIPTNARALGKAKTAVSLTSVVGLAFPESKDRSGVMRERVASVGLTLASCLSVLSGRSLVKDLSQKEQDYAAFNPR